MAESLGAALTDTASSTPATLDQAVQIYFDTHVKPGWMALPVNPHPQFTFIGTVPHIPSGVEPREFVPGLSLTGAQLYFGDLSPEYKIICSNFYLGQLQTRLGLIDHLPEREKSTILAIHGGEEERAEGELPDNVRATLRSALPEAAQKLSAMTIDLAIGRGVNFLAGVDLQDPALHQWIGKCRVRTTPTAGEPVPEPPNLVVVMPRTTQVELWQQLAHQQALGRQMPATLSYFMEPERAPTPGLAPPEFQPTPYGTPETRQEIADLVEGAKSAGASVQLVDEKGKALLPPDAVHAMGPLSEPLLASLQSLPRGVAAAQAFSHGYSRLCSSQFVGGQELRESVERDAKGALDQSLAAQRELQAVMLSYVAGLPPQDLSEELEGSSSSQLIVVDGVPPPDPGVIATVLGNALAGDDIDPAMTRGIVNGDTLARSYRDKGSGQQVLDETGHSIVSGLRVHQLVVDAAADQISNSSFAAMAVYSPRPAGDYLRDFLSDVGSLPEEIQLRMVIPTPDQLLQDACFNLRNQLQATALRATLGVNSSNFGRPGLPELSFEKLLDQALQQQDNTVSEATKNPQIGSVVFVDQAGIELERCARNSEMEWDKPPMQSLLDQQARKPGPEQMAKDFLRWETLEASVADLPYFPGQVKEEISQRRQHLGNDIADDPAAGVALEQQRQAMAASRSSIESDLGAKRITGIESFDPAAGLVGLKAIANKVLVAQTDQHLAFQVGGGAAVVVPTAVLRDYGLHTPQQGQKLALPVQAMAASQEKQMPQR